MSENAGAGFWSEGELEMIGHCPGCGEPAHFSGYRYKGLRDELEGVPGRWNMRACRSCSSLFLDPRPNRASMGKSYRSYYTHQSGGPGHLQDNGETLSWKLANGYLNARYGARRSPALDSGRHVIPLLPPLRQQLDYFFRDLPGAPGRLLDVGCGNGVFLLRASDAGWDATGIDPDPLAVAAAQKDGLGVTQGTFEDLEPAGMFDVITASHVIEHVYDPGLFLQKARACLVDGGMIWLATPNVASLGHAWYGASWRGLEPPRHINVFSSRALEAMLVEAGFDSIQFRRRGRGASYAARASREIAMRSGRKMLTLPPALVDIAASCMAKAGEELVVTARKRLP